MASLQSFASHLSINGHRINIYYGCVEKEGVRGRHCLSSFVNKPGLLLSRDPENYFIGAATKSYMSSRKWRSM